MSMRNHDSRAMRAVDRARRLARRAAIEGAIEDGAEVISRPAYLGAQHEVRDVEPMAGFRAAHELEIGARYTARRYLREAREAGFTWRDLGMAMDAGMRRQRERAGGSAAELAYQYAVENNGQPRSYYDVAFSWTCLSCDELISDGGPFDAPAVSQPGHARDCERLARAEADWDADWEAAQQRAGMQVANQVHQFRFAASRHREGRKLRCLLSRTFQRQSTSARQPKPWRSSRTV